MTTKEQMTTQAKAKFGPTPAPLTERLMKYVRVEGDCWTWTGAIGKDDGYGRVSYGHANSKLAHRIAHMAFIGPIPEGLELDHLCRNRACINPEHLEPVTRSTNLKRGLAETSPQFRNYWASKTHCPRGHPYDLINTHFDKYGHRFCRECNKESKRERRRENDYKRNNNQA